MSNMQIVPYTGGNRRGGKRGNSLVVAGLIAGARRVYQNREQVWNGAKWLWAKASKWRGNGAAIPHPQTLPGAVAAPVAYSYQTKGNKPRFQSSRGSVIITHREYVNVVEGSAGTFVVKNGSGPANSYSLNPLNPFLFPWLNSIAANFDQYVFKSVRLEYTPIVGTSTAGRVALYFDKDSQDRGPSDRSALANYQHLAEMSPWAVARLQLPTDNTKRFINDNLTNDPKLVDAGQIGWVTYGPSSGEFGDLFIEYTVELFEAQPSAPLIQSLFRNAGTGALTLTGPPYFTLESASAAQIVHQARVPGTYLVTIIYNSTTSDFTLSLAGQGTINSSFGTKGVVVVNLTIVRNANLVLSGLVGATNSQIFAVRAVPENAVQVV